MGKVLLRRNDPQTSLLYLQHAEKMDPGNYMTHTLLGQAYRSLGREEDARKEMDMAAKIHAGEELKLQPGSRLFLVISGRGGAPPPVAYQLELPGTLRPATMLQTA